LKVLLAHNFYGSSAPSGENRVYLAEKELLKSHGHTVIEFTRGSDEIRGRGFWGELKGALATPWNPFTVKRIRQLLKTEKPDILHAHNTFPLLSPSVFHAGKEFPTAIVLTLHNYRIFCAAAIPMRASKVCTECLDTQSVVPALRYGCYRRSHLATIPLALMISLHRRVRTWSEYVDAFIALTEFQREALAGAGLPREKTYVKPHFYADPPNPLPWKEREEKIVYIGRLGEEKGVHVLINAWKDWENGAPQLEIIGDGPLRQNIERMTGHPSKSLVRITSQLPFDETQRRLAKAKLLVLPSLCFEGFPMVIREAFALGVPVAASRLGAIPSIISEGKNGILFEAGNAGDIQRRIEDLWGQQGRLSLMGESARAEFEKKYTSGVNYQMLMEIYHRAIDCQRERHKRVG
jgi:glycosyltransferase involved in cell wall biosynthesis